MISRIRKKQLIKYIGQEYVLAFLVAFVFFFFIFFINQILLLAKKILLSNVDFFTMIHLVVLAIPQFLLYTFPFASLSGAAMVIGDFNSSNEILALRSCGFSIKDIYIPIALISIIFSIVCFLVADILMPYSALKYQQLYIELLTKSPGVELKSYSSNVFDNFLITNGTVDNNKIEDVTLLRNFDDNSSMVINSKKGELNLIDANNLIYTLNLEKPKIIFSDTNDLENWQIVNASNAIYYIDFSSNLSKVSANLPSNYSSVDLITKINQNKPLLKANVDNNKYLYSSTALNLAKNFEINKTSNNLNLNSFIDDYNYLPQINLRPIDFYLNYYRAELSKKFALSAACFFLILITIPLSFMKFKHGRLVGFGMSMFIAIVYWYLLFIAQLKTFQFAINPFFIIWAPNLIVVLLSIILIWLWRV